MGDGRLDRRDLAPEALIVDARAAPDPMLGRPAVKRRIDRRRDGGVADAHLADGEEVGAAGDRLHAEGHGGDAGLLVHGVGLGDVAGRHVDGQIEDLEA